MLLEMRRNGESITSESRLLQKKKNINQGGNEKWNIKQFDTIRNQFLFN